MLALCCDNLAKGNRAGVGDILMQRFKAVESAASNNTWEFSKHPEILPETQFQASSQREREAAAKMVIREPKFQQDLRRGGHRRSPG